MATSGLCAFRDAEQLLNKWKILKREYGFLHVIQTRSGGFDWFSEDVTNEERWDELVSPP